MRQPEQFADFVAARQGSLLRLTLAMTGERTAAEDLAQSALAQLWPRWERVVAKGDPWAYLERIVLNTRTSWWRKRRIFLVGGDDISEVPAESDAFDGADTRQMIINWVARLPPRQRSVIVARYLMDMSVDEAAEALDCSAGTVKSQTAKALGQLRGIAGLETKTPQGKESEL